MGKKQSKQIRRKYDEGFKTEVLRMVTAGRRTAEVARSLGIGENLLYKWRALWGATGEQRIAGSRLADWSAPSYYPNESARFGGYTAQKLCS